ncbi:helix-turn-helix transcriptional regulator [Novosphingobium naphthalenivorans]|jgi:prophage regulatory protein|uniref:helix-turn-helix transcriptional regulator n=1 Tax=Novosphingobium naphthalenivorans TaxID=273168 RepID=UPI00082E6BC6|nr:AlpA family phage regulatory protein [Novosphingobium naphthalenivorans]
MDIQFIAPKKVCEKIAVSRGTLDNLVARGEFPQPFRITPGRLAFDAAEVEQWMKERLERAA